MRKEILDICDVPTLYETGFFTQLTSGRPLSKKPHSHTFCEFICVLSGACEHVINGESRKMSVSDAVLLRPDDCHFFENQLPSTDVFALSVVNANLEAFLTAYAIEKSAIFDSKTPLLFKIPTDEFEHFKRLLRLTVFGNGDERTVNCRLALGEITGLILKSSKPSTQIPKELLKIVSEMQTPENIKDGMSALLRISHFSRSHLARLTATHLKQTPSEFINSLRLKRAADMLRATDLPIEFISSECGFSSYSYFCRIFKEKYRTTPSHFRHSVTSELRTL